MEDSLISDIQAGLGQTRANLDQWSETTPQEKKQMQVGFNEACVDTHLHVIDETLEKIEEGLFGVCEICHEPVDAELLQMDYTATVCLGHFTPKQLRELESELELSQVVQRALLPQRGPSIPGLDVSAFSRPAQIVSGDYFDFVRFKDQTHGMVIADVSGHGVSAGMLMTSLQTAFHTLTPEVDSPSAVLNRINRLYVHNVRLTTFVTAFFGKFDPETQVLDYASAGQPIYHYRADSNEVLHLLPTGPAIGLLEGFSMGERQVELSEGDMLVLYTDGVTEAKNPKRDQFGDKALAELIHQNGNISAEQLVTKIVQTVNGFVEGAPLEDDVTVVVYKVK